MPAKLLEGKSVALKIKERIEQYVKIINGGAEEEER